MFIVTQKGKSCMGEKKNRLVFTTLLRVYINIETHNTRNIAVVTLDMNSKYIEV